MDGAALIEIVCSYSWDCGEAPAVVWCESRFDPSAISPDGSNIGLWQINVIHGARVEYDYRRLLDPHTNTAIAWQLYVERGWQPWACRPG